MSSRLRILVVDDSVVVRRMLTEMLSSDPAIESVSTASNGKIALARIPQVNPDAIVLDVEMPEMDGLQTVAEIRRFNKTLPVIMFSTVTAAARPQPSTRSHWAPTTMSPSPAPEAEPSVSLGSSIRTWSIRSKRIVISTRILSRATPRTPILR